MIEERYLRLLFSLSLRQLRFNYSVVAPLFFVDKQVLSRLEAMICPSFDAAQFGVFLLIMECIMWTQEWL